MPGACRRQRQVQKMQQHSYLQPPLTPAAHTLPHKIELAIPNKNQTVLHLCVIMLQTLS